MAALLAAEVEALAQHLIDDLAIPHAGAHDAPARRRDGCVQPRVAHDGADQGSFRQLALR